MSSPSCTCSSHTLCDHRQDIPPGKYVIIAEEDVNNVGMFDMGNTDFCYQPGITCCGGMSPDCMTVSTMGVYRIVAVAYTLIIRGKERGFVVQTGLIHETKKSGITVHGLLVGPLHNMTKREEDRMMRCLKKDTALVTENMWYTSEWMGKEKMCEKETEEDSKEKTSKKRKWGDDDDEKPAEVRVLHEPKT